MWCRSKLAHGLLSGKYALKADDDEDSDRQVGISPHMFKHLVGRGHAEFATKKQQDAQEYFLHLVNVLEVSSATNNTCTKIAPVNNH